MRRNPKGVLKIYDYEFNFDNKNDVKLARKLDKVDKLLIKQQEKGLINVVNISKEYELDEDGNHKWFKKIEYEVLK